MSGSIDGERSEVARAYGVLATSLNEAIGDVRNALGEHRDLVRPGLVADLDRLLEELDRRRVRIAIYGEVKAGKSTLLNALAGATLSPVAFDPLTSVPVRVTYGNRTLWRVGDREVHDVGELAHLMRGGGGEVREVVAETDVDLLRLGGQVDLMDTPGVGSEERFDAISSQALRALDAVILVVRYPALFTQFTRNLMRALESDIGKLFVVWNLDADCAELSADERARHAETLRTKVAGAHELYLVDARVALGAARDGDGAGREASGLSALVAGLSRFVTSDERPVVALREAAKKTQDWVAEAQQILQREHDRLGTVLAAARQRLQAAHAATAAKVNSAQAQFGELESELDRRRDERAKSAAALAADLGREIRAARRRWVRTADVEKLVVAIAAATKKYADATAANNRRGLEQVEAAMKKFGAECDLDGWTRREPTASPAAPEERLDRARRGRWRFVRRALWRRWYLPGVDQLERARIADDLTAQASWFEAVLRTVTAAARALLDRRLIELRAEEAAEIAAIKQETSYDTAEAKFSALERDLPVLGARLANIAQINVQARGLLG
jgi:predicted GTPase